MRNWMWIILAVVLIIGAFLFIGNRQEVTQPGEEGVGGGSGLISEKMEIQLNAIDKGRIDQSGKAILEEKNGKVVVIIDVDGIESLNNQPAHIHAGTCPGVGEIVFPLNNVVDGKSVTEIDTTIEQLISSGTPMALNIHKSFEEIDVYTTCGELQQ